MKDDRGIAETLTNPPEAANLLSMVTGVVYETTVCDPGVVSDPAVCHPELWDAAGLRPKQV